MKVYLSQNGFPELRDINQTASQTEVLKIILNLHWKFDSRKIPIRNTMDFFLLL